MDLSGRLQAILDERGWSQADLCRATNLSTAIVSQVVSGSTKNPKISTVITIAQGLDVSIDYLIYGDRPER